MKFDVTKVFMLLVWAAVFVAPFGVFPPKVAMLLQLLGVVLVVAHVIEYALFHRTIRARPESGPTQIGMTLLFGVFYWKDWPSALLRRPSD